MSELSPDNHENEAELAKAAVIISDLMDMLKDHPDYHGSGPIDDGFKFLSQREEAGYPTPESMTEAELIEIIADLPRAISPLGQLAFDEYMKRRGEVINRAIAERKASDES